MKKTDFLFCILLFFNILFLIFFTTEISIYYKELQNLMLNESIEAKIANLSIKLLQWVNKDIALRIPFILIHGINCILLYLISNIVLKNEGDKLLSVVIFMLIPGVGLEALLVSKATLITFLTLMIVYISLRHNKIEYFSFILLMFLGPSASIVILSLFFYSLMHKQIKNVIFAIICFAINMYIFSPIRGVPNAYFLDTVGLFAILFSPVLFVYYCYGIYFNVFKSKPNLLALIPFVGLIFILILSVRQEIKFELFMPPIVIGVPLVVLKLQSDIRMRLSYFNKIYRFRFYTIFIFLLIENIILFGNKITYLFNPQLNFAASFYGAKEIANLLKQKGIKEVHTTDKNLQDKLNFYGIKDSSKFNLIPAYQGELKIIYMNRIIGSYDIKISN